MCVIIFDIYGFLITFHGVTFLVPSRCAETKSLIYSGVQVPEVSLPFINNSTRNKWVCRDGVPRSDGLIFISFLFSLLMKSIMFRRALFIASLLQTVSCVECCNYETLLLEGSVILYEKNYFII